MAALCDRLPKAELHAHIHGCARLSTIARLAPSGVDTECLRSLHRADRSLEACFAIFAAIHQTVTTLHALRLVTLEVLSDFAADGVKYIELRTTPRTLKDADMVGYVECVLSAISEFERRQLDEAVAWPLTVRLILSVDRTGTLDQAMETAHLAGRLSKCTRYIVGLDFSGNPTRGSFGAISS